MEDLQYKYELNINIGEPNDSSRYYSQKIDFSSSYRIRGSNNKKVNVSVNPPRAGYRKKGEPIINEIASSLTTAFGWGRRQQYDVYRAPDDFDIMFEFGTENKGFVLISREKPHYKLMGLRTEKKNMTTALSRVIYRSCFEEDGRKLGNYLMQMVTLPENVSYAIENRAPYDFFHDGNRIESRLNVKRISDQECAMEISDGVWGAISTKELDRFMNSYHLGHTRSKKWNMCSPKKLWTELIGTPPSDIQLKRMKGFLSQNRTDAIVE